MAVRPHLQNSSHPDFVLNIRQCLSVQISAFLTDHTAQILRNAEYIRHYLIRVLEYINIDALQNIERRILSICARHIDCISLIDVPSPNGFT